MTPPQNSHDREQASAARDGRSSLPQVRSWCARWARIVPAALLAAMPAPARSEVAACAATSDRPERGSLPIMGVMGLDSTMFEQLTGTPIAQLHTFVPRQEGWSPISGRSSGSRIKEAKDALADAPEQTVVISYSPIPQRIEGPRRQALGKCAAGYFNQHYVDYGRSLAERNLDRFILRIGWEWDADFPWGADRDLYQAQLYGDCFAQVVRSIRRGFPDNRILFDWNSTLSVTQDLLEAGYPGDEVVDIVSVEGYDNRGGSTPQERWAAVERQFDMVRDFGLAHGKKLAFPEWGIWSAQQKPSWGGGDNPYHIQKVCEYAKNPANNVLYLNYFNRSNEYADHRLQANPRSLNAFRTYCRGFAATVGEEFWRSAAEAEVDDSRGNTCSDDRSEGPSARATRHRERAQRRARREEKAAS